MTRRKGAMPDHRLQYLMEHGCIIGADGANVGPASLKLRLSDEIYRIEGVTLPRMDMTVWQLRNVLKGERVVGGHLIPGVAYLAKLQESLALPEGIEGTTNPTSTVGRLNINAQVVVDKQPKFDTIPHRFAGDLWVIIEPQSFSVRVREGSEMVQLRLFDADTQLSQLELEVEMQANTMIWKKTGSPYEMDDFKLTDKDGTCLLTLDLDRPVGWRARRHTPEVDLDARHLSVEEYFDPIEPAGGMVTFLPDHFHIFSSAQCVRVPPHLAGRMLDMGTWAGDFRAKNAGLIDPGWGYGKDGEGTGRPLTLEIRPRRPLYVGKGIPVAKLGFERLVDLPDLHYDARSASYSHQRSAQLAKQFAR